MANRYENMVVSAASEVDNSSGSATLVEAPGPTLYLWIERLNISVSKAATGGGGEVIVQTTAGTVIYRVNADGVKDVPLNWGDEGLRVGPGVGLQAVTANAQGNQATASVAVSGHLAFR